MPVVEGDGPVGILTAHDISFEKNLDQPIKLAVFASNRRGRERLLRYCASPPLSLERLSALCDGRIACAIRKPWG